MKQLIVAALVSLVSGIFFSLGVVSVIAIVESWRKSPPAENRGLDYTRLPNDVRVVEHSRVPGMPYYTIRGIVENSGTTKLYSVSIEATIKAGGAMVNECDTEVRGAFEANSRRAFQMDCFNVAGGGDPDTLTHELSVVSAGTLKK